jgi:hypothetical protein
LPGGGTGGGRDAGAGIISVAWEASMTVVRVPLKPEHPSHETN